MFRDVSACNTYNYGDALYWDSRYIQEANCGSFDWYQRYSALRPLVRSHIPTSSRVLVVGCGNALMSEDMVKDGYEDIMNIDISSVAIEMMRRKYEHMPQLKCILYMQMDVRDMSFFPDESFNSVVDKGTLDSLLCGNNAPISAKQMLGEVSRLFCKLYFWLVYVPINIIIIAIVVHFAYYIPRAINKHSFVNILRLLKPGGVYMLITYGDPTVRIPHLSPPVYSWKIKLYVIPRPGFQGPTSSTSLATSLVEPVPINEKGQLPADYVLEDPDSHFIYICEKMDELSCCTSIESPNSCSTTDNV